MNRRGGTRSRRTAMGLVAAAVLGAGLSIAVANEAQAAPTEPWRVPSQSLGTLKLNTTYSTANATKLGARMGPARSVSWILANANREPRTLNCPNSAGNGAFSAMSGMANALGMCWSNAGTGGSDDFNGSVWIPQGITTTADAQEDTTYDGVRATAVTWDSADDSLRTRVTLMGADSAMDDQNYRHILLVEPTSSGDFSGALNCHAGGAAWYGHLLYVACTSTVRIFDWDHVYSADTSSACDTKIGGGTKCASGYALVMAQVGTVKPATADAVRFSSLSIDRAASPDRLVVSEYYKATDNQQGKLIRYSLDYTTRRLSSGNVADAWYSPWEKVQGAVTRGTKMWFNSSNGDTYSGWLRFWDSDSGQPHTPYNSAIGAESLSYWGWGDGPDGRPDRLYTLSEHAGKRAVVAVRQQDVN